MFYIFECIIDRMRFTNTVFFKTLDVLYIDWMKMC